MYNSAKDGCSIIIGVHRRSEGSFNGASLLTKSFLDNLQKL